MILRFLLLVTVAAASVFAQPAPWIQLASGAARPTTCTSGTAFFETSAPLAKAFLVCDSSGKWTQQDPDQYNVFIVQNFGAKGDGAADDLTALRNAADTASHAGGIVFFPPGTYRHSGMVDFGSNTLVQGAGDSSIVTGSNHNNSALRFVNSRNSGIQQIRTVSHATTRLTTDTSAAILFFGASSCFARNVAVEGSASVGIMVEGSAQMVIDSNRVRNTEADGIHVVGGSHDVQVINNRAYNTGDDSFSAVAYADASQTRNVTFDSNVSMLSRARGVACIGPANCTITNNKIYNPVGHGIAISYESSYNTYHPSGAVVKHNLVRGASSVVMNPLLVAFATNVQVADLQIYDSSPLYCHGSSQVKLTGIRVWNAQGAAILGAACSQLALQDVQVNTASGQGINFQGVQGGSLANVTLSNIFAGGSTGAGAIEIDDSSNVTGSASVVTGGNNGNSPGGLISVFNSTGTSVGVAASKDPLPSQPSVEAKGVVGSGFNSPPVQSISENGMLSVFGSALSGDSAGVQAQSGNLVDSYLPQSLSSTCVEAGGRRTYLLFASKGQINFVTPSLPPGESAMVEVVSNCGQPDEIRSNAVMLPVVSAAPEFFLAARNGANKNHAIVLDTETLTPRTVVHPGEEVTLYLGGLGALRNGLAPGLVGGGADSTLLPVSVLLGGTPLSSGNVLYCGSSGYAGLYQLNLRLPATLPNGDVPIEVTIGGASTASVVYLSVSPK